MNQNRFDQYMHCCENPYAPHEKATRWVDPESKSGPIGAKLDELRASDPSALSKLKALQKRAVRGRIKAKHVEKREVSFPAGLKVNERDLAPNEIPLLVGLKCADHRENRPDGQREYRVYFGDVTDAPENPTKRMVATRFFQSRGGMTQKEKDEAQTNAIKNAMKTLIWWCHRQPTEVIYRPQGSGDLRG